MQVISLKGQIVRDLSYHTFLKHFFFHFPLTAYYYFYKFRNSFWPGHVLHESAKYRGNRKEDTFTSALACRLN